MKIGKKLFSVFLILGVLALSMFVYMITHQHDIIDSTLIGTASYCLDGNDRLFCGAAVNCLPDLTGKNVLILA